MTRVDLALLLLRLAVGVFFASSGYHKLFVPDVHTKLVGLFKRLGCYSPLTVWLVPAAELAGGLGLIWGCLTVPAALGLVVVLAGAIYLDTIHEVVAAKPRDVFDWCAKLIYMPEGLLVVVLLVLALAGGGAVSVDHEVVRWLRG